MTNLCNVDGEIVPEGEARIPVLDRGFLFGDSIYEVIRTRQGIPFAWPEHLARLHASAEGLQMDLPLDDADLTRRIVDTLAAAGNAESYVRVVVTRGLGTAPSIDIQCALGSPCYIVMVRDLPAGVGGETAQVAIVPRLRLDRRALDPAIKSGNYLNNVMGLKEARARGATDCLFMNQDGVLTEASTSNVWIVKDGEVVTPALSAGLLAGVTRRLLMAMCEEQGIRCVEKDLTRADVLGADGLFLTSTLRDISPVDAVDGETRPVCDTVTDLAARFLDYCDRIAVEVYKPAIEALVG